MNYYTTIRVPIVPQDLRHEETIVQIAAALDFLASASNNIFQHISSHVQKNTTKLSKLQARCRVIREKVDKLSGTNNATKVFSSAKYPAQEIFHDYPCQYINHPPCLKRVPIRSKPIPVDDHVLNDKLQLIHIKESSQMFRRNAEITPEEGLGPLPNDMDYVSSLLLFNTSQNLYKRYVMSDPLDKDRKSKINIDGEEKECIEAPPLSMSQIEQSELKNAFTFSYSPSLKEVPQLDLPLDLPDLPGIAGDLRYSIDLDPMITPSISVVSTPAFSELPSLIVETPTELAPPPPLPPILPEIAVLPTPPPPPPIPNQELIASLLPITISKIEKPIRSPIESKMEKPKPFFNDSRTNLMEAIRNAGGSGKAKLRSVDRKQEAKQAREEMKIGGGDLIADLHAKLSMRRKGISGKVKDEMGGDGILKRVLSMIPPPPDIPEGKIEIEEDSEDWDE